MSRERAVPGELFVDRCPKCREYIVTVGRVEHKRRLTAHDTEIHNEIRPVEPPEEPDYS